MMTRQLEAISERLSPELLCGVTLGRWLKILAENRFQVDAAYWPRAMVTTAFSLRNSVFGGIESLLYRRQIAQTPVEQPVFVLGIFRSGTTHLHNLLTQDRRFAYPTHYEVTFPSTFLMLERLDAACLGMFLAGSRPQDGVRLDFQQPHEDEVALCSLLGRTFLMDLAFPRNAAFYRRFYTLAGLSPDELRDWKQAMKYFFQKVTFRHKKPLILKSPGHTCRVRTLLEMFPDAKFIHIHRNPIDVYRSWVETIKALAPRWAFQKPDLSKLEDDIVEHYQLVHEAWFRDRSLIPAGRLYELSYEQLREKPLPVLEDMYQSLALPDFVECRPALESYLQQHASYRNNAYDPLPEKLQDRLRVAWKNCFDAWDYTP